MCVYTYIYIYMSLSLYVYIYIYINAYIYIYMSFSLSLYIYIYIHYGITPTGVREDTSEAARFCGVPAPDDSTLSTANIYPYAPII